jgi:hypothetical protein
LCASLLKRDHTHSLSEPGLAYSHLRLRKSRMARIVLVMVVSFQGLMKRVEELMK